MNNKKNGRSFRGRSSGRGYYSRNKKNGRGRKKTDSFDPSQYINKNPVVVEEEVFVPQHKFTDFGLDLALVNTLRKMRITDPSPIQDAVIPHIMEGRDVVGLAETGTGKTAAFLLPLIHKTYHDTNRSTLILAPTRELAIQINEEFRKLSQGFRLFSTICVGGMPAWQQIKHLQKPNDFIIGTPGRVMDLIKRNKIDAASINTVVLDEADRMLDMGFIDDMRYILGQTPDERETLFFSATMTKEAEGLVNDFLNDPIEISVKKRETADSIEQDVVVHDRDNKKDLLIEMLHKDEFERVIIFVETKRSAAQLAIDLSMADIPAESLHGDKEHRERQRALKQFKTAEVRVLVATDVAARGIHVDEVSHVINYDLPQQFEDYVHRIGRTGRGAHRGKALTFVPSEQMKVAQSQDSRGQSGRKRPAHVRSFSKRAPKPDNVMIRKI